MEGTGIRELERIINENETVERDGVLFSGLSLHPVIYEPRPHAISIRTLQSLVDYLASNRDDLDIKTLIAQVVDQGTVSLFSKIQGKDRNRDVFLAVKSDCAVFRFGEWYEHESFIIAVNSLFKQSKDRDDLLSYVSKIQIENEGNVHDDGISQEVSVRVGLKGNLTELKKAPSRILLTPFRTFAEIDQVESEFLFRMKNSDGGVKLALFEADGGKWKSIAMERIAAWIGNIVGEDLAILA